MNPTKKCVAATSQRSWHVPCFPVAASKPQGEAALAPCGEQRRVTQWAVRNWAVAVVEDIKVAGLKSLPPPFWVQKRTPPEMERGLEMASLFLTLFPIPLWPADSWKGAHTSFPLCRSPQLQLQLDLRSSELLWDLAAMGKVLAKKVMLYYYHHHQHAERCSCFPFVY